MSEQTLKIQILFFPSSDLQASLNVQTVLIHHVQKTCTVIISLVIMSMKHRATQTIIN